MAISSLPLRACGRRPASNRSPDQVELSAASATLGSAVLYRLGRVPILRNSDDDICLSSITAMLVNWVSGRLAKISSHMYPIPSLP